MLAQRSSVLFVLRVFGCFCDLLLLILRTAEVPTFTSLLPRFVAEEKSACNSHFSLPMERRAQPVL